MRATILLLFLFLIQPCMSQTIIKESETYREGDTLFFAGTRNLVSGQIEIYHKGKTERKDRTLDYLDGMLVKTTKFFYRKNNVPHWEFHFDRAGNRIKEVKYSNDHKKMEVKVFEANGDRKTEERFENGQLRYICEYKNDKKKLVRRIDENGVCCETVYQKEDSSE